jgi:hypothetical protein
LTLLLPSADTRFQLLKYKPRCVRSLYDRDILLRADLFPQQMRLKLKHLRHPLQTLARAKASGSTLLKQARFADLGQQRFKNDPRYDLQNLTGGSRSRSQPCQNDADLLEAYQPSKWRRGVRQASLGGGDRNRRPESQPCIFLASIVSDRRLSEDLCVNVIQAFYQHWRLRSHKADLPATILQDRVNKRRVPASG